MTEQTVIQPDMQVYANSPGILKSIGMMLYGLVRMILRFTKAGESVAGTLEALAGTGENMALSQKRVQSLRVQGTEAQEMKKLKSRFPDMKFE